MALSGTRSPHHASPAETLARLALEIERMLSITVSLGHSYNKSWPRSPPTWTSRLASP